MPGDPRESVVLSAEPCKQSLVADDPWESAVLSAEPCKQSLVAGDPWESAVFSAEPCKQSLVDSGHRETVMGGKQGWENTKCTDHFF